MKIKPFRGWRPRRELADKIPSLPYDVMDSDEARVLAEGDPHTFLHVVKPEIDLDPSISVYDDRVYDRGRANLKGLMDSGDLARDEAPAFYLYRVSIEGHSQLGLVAAAAVDDYRDGKIKRHEFTRPEKENDRTRHIETMQAHPGPVFLTYRPVPELTALLNALSREDATVDFTAVDGVRHELWPVSDVETCAKIEGMFARIPATYVADGHHRAAAASRAGASLRERLEEPTGQEPCNYFLAVHFPSDQMRILDYNRIVKDLNGLTPADLLEKIKAAGYSIREDWKPRRAEHPETFGMYVDGRWFCLVPGGPVIDGREGTARLDVSILTETVLQPILGIGDPRSDKRIEFVGGIRGMDELERRVDSGDWGVAFSLYPTSMDSVMQVADAGEVMPPKSTWFEPKLRSGMVVLSLEGETL